MIRLQRFLVYLFSKRPLVAVQASHTFRVLETKVVRISVLLWWQGRFGGNIVHLLLNIGSGEWGALPFTYTTAMALEDEGPGASASVPSLFRCEAGARYGRFLLLAHLYYLCRAQRKTSEN